MPDTAIFDVDGTLVDSNHHHALAWYRAFLLDGKAIADVSMTSDDAEQRKPEPDLARTSLARAER
ncbi:hypothetical protein [Modestobacter lacusdianchii]